MATLTLTVGAQSVSVTMPDAKATTLIADVIDATDGPADGTARQRGLWVLRECATHLRTIQRRALHTRKNAALDAEIEAAGDWVDA